MKNIIVLICLLGTFLNIGCVTSRQKNSAKSNRSSEASTAGLKPSRMSPEEKQDKKDRDLVMKKKSELTGVNISAAPQKKGESLSVIPSKIIGSDLSGLNETELYNHLFLAYEKNDQLAFNSALALFIKKYPQSVRADDALYLAGLNAVASHDYGTALKHFNRVLKEYSYSNKAPSALFAKAAVLKKMEMIPNSQEAFKQVLLRYPQSPESERAQVELRLFK